MPGGNEGHKEVVNLAVVEGLLARQPGASRGEFAQQGLDFRGEKGRVAEDVRALVGRDLPVTVLSARTGVFHGTTIRHELRFAGPAPSAGDLKAALLATGYGFAEADVDGPAGIVDAAGRDETLLLGAWSAGSTGRLFLASDALRRPGALLAVRVAEAAVADRGLLPDA